MAFAVFAAIVLLAFAVQTALGFGSMVIAVALGAFVMPIPEIVATLVPIILLNVLYLSLRHLRHVDWRVLLRRILPLMLLGMPIGFAALRVAEERVLKMVFGAFVCLLAGLELWAQRRRVAATQPLSTPKVISLLLGAGAFHGMYAAGGPMVVYVAGRDLPQKSTFRATLAVLWVALDALLLVGFAIDGTYDSAQLAKVGLLLAPLGLGMLVGEWLHSRLDDDLFVRLVYIGLLLSGIMLIAFG